MSLSRQGHEPALGDKKDFLGWDYQTIRSMLGDTLAVLMEHLNDKYKHPLDRLVVIKDILSRLKNLSVDGNAPHKAQLRDFFNDLLPYLGMAAESEYNMAVRALNEPPQLRIEEVEVPEEDEEDWVDIDLSDEEFEEDAPASAPVKKPVVLTREEKLRIIDMYGNIQEQLGNIEHNLRLILGDPEDAKAEAEAAYAETFQGMDDALARVQATLAATGYDKKGRRSRR